MSWTILTELILYEKEQPCNIYHVINGLKSQSLFRLDGNLCVQNKLFLDALIALPINVLP